ncbi:arginine--tRNA ligase [Oscillochloris sp. ZM17-4]|uniref:arginine--tRNA ligase n=1 Tax=Oscillochloris sp. ZM17-4 TaxID=2866714 RepID=UPI001C73B741|nr:arginine--tRNA ligase [Oscillochloris sp. ZM17-4]MBX0326186.1 arginine--tRNA ligase [Oscillochloris sp. ZM17-4]
MEYALERFTAEVKAAIAATGRVAPALIETTTPKPNIPADLAFPAFRAAKELRVPPPQLAAELAAAISIPEGSLIGKVEAAGPFLNFSMHPQRLAAAVLAEIAARAEGYGRQPDGAGQTIVVDYSAPNIAKRMHVGHIRSTIIGQSLVNIFRALGYTVVGDNHLGDWGKQFGVVLASIAMYGRPDAVGEEAMALLEAQYARYSGEMKERPDLDEEARRWSLLLEQGDPQARALWQWCVDLTLQAAEKNYNRLGVRFDHAYGESFYEGMLPDMIAETLRTEAAYRDEDGSVVAELDKLPKFIIQRKDGGTVYMTRDIATVEFRLSEFHPSQIIYVVDGRQELHFRQLFAIMRAMGYARDVELVHIPFGVVTTLDGQPLSTKKGNMVYLESLLDEATARALAVIDLKNPDLAEAEKAAVAESVGVGAVVYNDLYQDTKRNITLDWERMLATEGNSATYLQYSHARCRSILRRAVEEGAATAGDATLLTHPAETGLIKHLARLPEALREAGSRYAPFVIADWCYTTAREFGVFFEQCPVLKAESAELRAARLDLVAATAHALKAGLGLLGIRAPERM